MGLLPTYSPQPVNLRSLYFDAPAPAGIASRTPNLGERITDALHGMGMDQRQANRLGDKVSGALNMFTPLGAIPEAQQAKSSYRAGNYGSALAHGVAAAVSAVPDGGMFAHGAGAVAHSIIAPLFHGSPHAFEKFALDKIGTGEGAQAYGHGLYFAENPAVAKEYQKQTAGDGFLTAAGQVFDPSTLGHMNVRSTLNRTGSLDEAIAKAQGLLPSANEQTRPLLVHDLQTLTRLHENGGISRNAGHLYQVSLDANPEDFLDWDKSITQQPSDVRDALASAGFDVNDKMPTIQTMPSGKTFWIQHPGGWEPMGAPRFRTRDKAEQWLAANGPDMATWRTGQNLWSQALGQAPNAAQAAANLNNLGLSGIKYFDAGSRVGGNLSGQGTRNYVVFDPSIIDILNRH